MTGVVLFYKRIVSLGGAEVLLAQHYAHLKIRGESPVVVCFEYENLERINVDKGDLITVPGNNILSQTINLSRILSKQRNALFYCHSGYIEFGFAAMLAQVPYGVFLHQPTTMSFNETDKFSVRYWSRYQSFAKHDEMYDRLCAQRDGMSLLKKLYVNARAVVSQSVLQRASVLFVLSNYAVHEKAQIFGLNATCLAGAILSEQVDALTDKAPVRKPDGQFILVSVSRIDINKRIDILIHAVSVLRNRGIAVQLKLGGTGPALDELKELSCSLGVEDSVIFLGYVPESDIPALYEEMDLFVTIDWADYRITTYEVLAENRRVVVSDDTDADPDLLESGYFFTSTPNADALADVVEKALVTPVCWDKEHLADYLSQFSWSTYFDRITESLRQNHA